MSFPQYPPIIKGGQTISNLILVDSYEYDRKKKNHWGKDSNTIGFSEPFNFRDIFLNVNGGNNTPKECLITIQHEVLHNALEKNLNPLTSEKLDNLFYNVKTRRKIKKNLFGLIELSKKEAKEFSKIKRLGGKKRMGKEDDFWIFSGSIRI